MGEQCGLGYAYDGIDALVAAIMRRAVADAQQTEDPALAREAWAFLETTAPTIAAELHRRLQKASLETSARI